MNSTTSSPPHATTSRRPRLGLSWPALVGLALLAAPRVVLHDLDLIQEGTSVNALFVFVPLLIWVAVVWAARVPKPFLTLLVVGALYGVILAVGHQLLWETAVGARLPDAASTGMSPAALELLVRGTGVVSSLVTGTVVGAVTGLVAWGLAALTGRRAGAAGRGPAPRPPAPGRSR
ncbi:hypothetical protein GC722_07485 [Auraticoccus sp. F435]|uniref:Uncharacterized protein n=1 Tax=Auraticoccus cholistanensis TaxID=2656650 RepID=A0A6A9UVZ3_9ACTN|nr:hypothetical protein [Auraticoccus cholistanensis]MVA75865.1 hypothetical protein [Auraticoccus cholistanensis]